jgi:hypothetical protein
MIFQEPVYDLYTLAEYNLHIHTVYSDARNRTCICPTSSEPPKAMA